MEELKAYATIKYQIEKRDENGNLIEIIEREEGVTKEQAEELIAQMGGE